MRPSSKTPLLVSSLVFSLGSWGLISSPTMAAGREPSPLAPEAGFVFEESRIEASVGDDAIMFGTTVAGVGDVDADGFDDALIGAPPDYGGLPGAVYMYFGSLDGLDGSSELVLTLEDSEGLDLFGAALGRGGDLNTDGYADFAIGASSRWEYPRSGSVSVYFGTAEGPELAIELWAPVDRTGWRYGYVVDGAGDIDGDAVDDLLVTNVILTWDGWEGESTGLVYLYTGSSSGLSDSPDYTLDAIRGGTDMYGTAASGAGDLDGDGLADLCVGAQGTSRAYVYLGSAEGVGPTPDVTLEAGTWSVYFFGRSVSGAGDTDSDGYDDLLVGASEIVYLFEGGVGGPDPSSWTSFRPADWTSGDHFGYAVSEAGDLDADGYDDVLVGAPDYAADLGHGFLLGAAYVFWGSAEGLDTSRDTPILPSPGFSSLGTSVDSAGDVDGDGVDGILLGAPSACYALSLEGSVDGDGDGFLAAEDCDDLSSAVHPGAADAWYDGVDSNCDGASDFDQDGDGYDIPEDCNDLSSAVHPGTIDAWYDGVDSDCDGASDFDQDGDDLDALSGGGTDCDDLDAAVHPGATEVCNEVDDDCDGEVDGPESIDASTWEADADEDGSTDSENVVRSCSQPDGFETASAQPDCDDADPSVYPGALDIPGDGIDQDCSGADARSPDTGSGPADTGEERPEKGCQCGASPDPGASLALWLSLSLLLRRRRELGKHEGPLVSDPLAPGVPRSTGASSPPGQRHQVQVEPGRIDSR